MANFLGIELVPASVSVVATVREAAAVLTAHPVSAVAVVDEELAVVGIFGSDELLTSLFPPYLNELRHTVFARDDPALLERRAGQAAGEAVRDHMARAVTVDAGGSAMHVAELFLHCEHDALPVVLEHRFVGMLGRSEFCRAMLEATAAREWPARRSAG
jgi:CBS-domain-containing membrane protein